VGDCGGAWVGIETWSIVKEADTQTTTTVSEHALQTSTSSRVARSWSNRSFNRCNCLSRGTKHFSRALTTIRLGTTRWSLEKVPIVCVSVEPFEELG
jgi:hypothetical protein